MTTEKPSTDLSSANRQIADLQKELSALRRRVDTLEHVSDRCGAYVRTSRKSPYTPRMLPRHKDWI